MLILSLLQNPYILVAFIIGLLLAITVHEYAHAWTAYRAGDTTPLADGRLTLNPIVHLDPLGTLFLFLIGFGWGKPVRTNPDNYQKKSDELKVAFSGVIANFILAFILAIPIRVALLTGHTIDSSTWLSMLNILVDLNLVLAAFNIIPIYPLDGSHLIDYFLDYRSRIAFHQYGPFILLTVLIIDRVSNFPILQMVMEPVIRFLSFLCKGTFSIFL